MIQEKRYPPADHPLVGWSLAGCEASDSRRRLQPVSLQLQTEAQVESSRLAFGGTFDMALRFERIFIGCSSGLSHRQPGSDTAIVAFMSISRLSATSEWLRTACRV